MISAIVLVPDTRIDDVALMREIVVRSMVWLVSAVVAGVVRDVTLAVPAGLGLSDVADQSGCALVEEDREVDRFAAAVEACREGHLVILKAGFQPLPGLVDEIDAFIRHADPLAAAVVLAAPETPLQRIFPDRAPRVGFLGPRSVCLKARTRGFDRLTRSVKRAVPLRTRAQRIR